MQDKKLPIQLILRILFPLLTLLIAALIWSFSFDSVEESSELSEGIVEIIVEHIEAVREVDRNLLEHIIRKSAHFTEFMLLGILSTAAAVVYTLPEKKRLPAHLIYAAIFCLFTASTDETIQLFTSRGNSLTDVALDFAGSLTGIILSAAVYLLISFGVSKHKQKINNTATTDGGDNTAAR